MKELEVHFTREQEAHLAQIAMKKGTGAEGLVTDATLRRFPVPLKVHFTPEQEAHLAQIARKEGTGAERLVRDAALRLLEEHALLEEDAPVNVKSRWQKLSPLEKGLFTVGCFLMGYGLVICAMQQWPQWPHLVTLPRLTIVIGIVCIVIVWWRFVHATSKHKTGSLLDDHENRSKKRYCLWQDSLDKYFVDATNDDELKKLAAKLDVQFKLEDFLLRFREAEHAKLKVWGTVFTAGLVSLVVALLNNLFHKG